ncbi:hypothetical protein CK203_048912 [Vitis vinifera]|uniref:Uncharacterized protein n=1 Tax=Vitis vinifera TaxID=29760 RepID=A0A438GVM7_VITVI|nr:hypothetical protein CK203_048912 [Vitis vinifera]
MRPSGQIWLTQRPGRNQWMPVCLKAADEVAGLKGENGSFAAEREEIETEYQKQVDDTFIFGVSVLYEEENSIRRDVPSIPPGEEKKLHDKPAP